MDDREAIEHYDRAGETRRGAFAAVRWPDLALDEENVARLVEGVLSARCDCARLAFGDEFDSAAAGDDVSEAWRTDALQTRYAPEGVFVRATFTVRVECASAGEMSHEEDKYGDPATIVETLRFTVELCVSFTTRHHTRSFVDFMGGEVRREGDGTTMRLDPFAHEIAPLDAVEWGLNTPP